MRAALLVAAVTLGVPSVAQAGGTDPSAAEALFRDGREAMRRGDPATACERFHESQRLDPAVGTLLNLAECEEKLGHVARAWARLREALEALSPNDDRVTDTKRKLGDLEGRLPHLTIRISPRVPSAARVVRDDVEVGRASLGVALPIDPGSHRVRVEAAGRLDRIYDVTVREGENADLLLEAGESTPVRSLPTSSGSGRTPAWIAFGAGGVALGVGVVSGLLAMDRNAFMDDHCEEGRLCPQEALDKGREGRVFDVTSTVSFVAAGVLIAGGIVWLVTHSSEGAR